MNLTQVRQRFPGFFQKSLSLTLFEELNGFVHALPGLIGSMLCMMQKPQIESGLPQQAFGAYFLCDID